MKLVMDLLFVDSLEFKIPAADARRVVATAPCMQDALAAACAMIGIELVVYDSVRFVTLPGKDVTDVIAHSRLWREKSMRGV